MWWLRYHCRAPGRPPPRGAGGPGASGGRARAPAPAFLRHRGPPAGVWGWRGRAQAATGCTGAIDGAGAGPRGRRAQQRGESGGGRCRAAACFRARRGPGPGGVDGLAPPWPTVGRGEWQRDRRAKEEGAGAGGARPPGSLLAAPAPRRAPPRARGAAPRAPDTRRRGEQARDTPGWTPRLPPSKGPFTQRRGALCK